MGLFDKKYCDICGDKIGMLGNRKLENGNLCKNCASKLSPWFYERKQSTVEEIREQLEYREANREAVAAFNITRTYGTNTKVHLDEDNRKFIVTSARSLADANPDVLDYSQITGCRLDIQENKSEMKQKGPDGKDVSYNPPQYKHSYNFYMVINVNHPYFNEIRFQLNNTSITVEPTIRVAPPTPVAAPAAASRPAMAANRAPVTPPNRRPAGSAMVNRTAAPAAQNNTIAGLRANAMATARAAAANAPRTPAQPAPQPVQQPANRVLSSTAVDPRTNADYVRFQQMGDDIVAALTQVREEYREELVAGNIPVMAVTCPWCGATTKPDASGCCEYCGGAVNG